MKLYYNGQPIDSNGSSLPAKAEDIEFEPRDTGLESNTVQGAIEELSASFARGEIYSMDETRIGTWIDGKPLYRKVIQMTSPGSTNSEQSVYSLQNDINVIYLHAALNSSIGGLILLPYYVSASNQASLFVLYNTIYMQVGHSYFTNRPVTAVVYYTKTTDQATSLQQEMIDTNFGIATVSENIGGGS